MRATVIVAVMVRLRDTVNDNLCKYSNSPHAFPHGSAFTLAIWWAGAFAVL